MPTTISGGAPPKRNGPFCRVSGNGFTGGIIVSLDTSPVGLNENAAGKPCGGAGGAPGCAGGGLTGKNGLLGIGAAGLNGGGGLPGSAGGA